jgi:hypothetical protein
MQLSQGQGRQPLAPEGVPPAACTRGVHASKRYDREEALSYADGLLVSILFLSSTRL